MAWIRWRQVKRTGRRHAYLAWRDEAGKERTKPLQTTDPAVAEALLREHQRAAGVVPSAVDAGGPQDALDAFLAELALAMRPGTVDAYRGKLQPLVDAWEGMPMTTWTRRAFVEYLAGKSWSDRTLQMVTGYARRWIAWARAADIPMPDFVGDFRPRPPRPQEREILTPGQVDALLAEAQGHYLEVPVALAVFAGLRRADILDLRWRHVDLEGRTIRTEMSKDRRGRVVEVPIAKPLEAILKRHERKRGPVCVGLPASTSSLSKALHRLCGRAEVPPGGWHRFRHTYATRLVAQGCDVPTVGKLLGHAPGSPVTLRYFQTDQATMRAAIDRAFGG